MKNAGRSSCKAVLLLASLAFLLGASIATASGQTAETNSEKKKAIKFDEIGDVGMCELRQRLIRFTSALSNKPDHQGYIINYSGDDGSIGDKQIARRERVITNAISFRNYDRNRITLVRGGQRLEQTTELWLVPPGSENPAPSGALETPDLRQDPGRLDAELFDKKRLEFYSGHLDEFILPLVRQRAAELKSKTANDESADDDGTEDPDSPSTRTEKESLRFRWADVGLAESITSTKGARGVIFFYADEELYDVIRLQAFVEQGRDRVAKHAGLSKTLLTVEFGGYRKSLEAEFWVVPRNGRPPTASPEEREEPCPDGTEN